MSPEVASYSTPVPPCSLRSQVLPCTSCVSRNAASTARSWRPNRTLNHEPVRAAPSPVRRPSMAPRGWEAPLPADPARALGRVPPPPAPGGIVGVARARPPMTVVGPSLASRAGRWGDASRLRRPADRPVNGRCVLGGRGEARRRGRSRTRRPVGSPRSGSRAWRPPRPPHTGPPSAGSAKGT